MKPSSPIIPGQDLPETIYAKDQLEYQPLPVWRDDDGTVLSRWHCTWPERLRILITGDVYLRQMTFNKPLQPIRVDAERPTVDVGATPGFITRLGRRVFKSALHAMSNKDHFDDPEPRWALMVWRCRNYVPRNWWAY